MIIYIASLLIFLAGFGLLINIWRKNHQWSKKYILEKRECNNYAILIPARNESKVIEDLLKSIKVQTSLKNTFVIVENEEDETINIVKKYGGNIIVRKDMEGKHRKGFALDEAIKEILKTRHFDLYFIFDADNTLNEHFLNRMVNVYENGYDIATGYRNIKNSINTITTCSGLIFSLINTLINKTRNKLNKGIIISGTGYFINGDLIEKWQGFPFTTLTEDYELSLYATANNLKTYYYDSAEFFDEQPTKYNISITQRTRWIKGFFEARTKRLKDIKNDYSKIIGITPYILMLTGLFMAIINSIFLFIVEIIKHGNYIYYLKWLIIFIVFIYIILQLLTLILIIKEKNKLNISKMQKLKAIFFNPIFLLSFIRCFFKSFKNIEWNEIKHGN